MILLIDFDSEPTQSDHCVSTGRIVTLCVKTLVIVVRSVLIKNTSVKQTELVIEKLSTLVTINIKHLKSKFMVDTTFNANKG